MPSLVATNDIWPSFIRSHKLATDRIPRVPFTNFAREYFGFTLMKCCAFVIKNDINLLMTSIMWAHKILNMK